MILVMLMLTSVLASIDFVELQEIKEIEETSGRANADPEVVAITSPRETSCTASGSCTNELLSGIPVVFDAYIRNSGDAALTDLQYQVKVYTDNNGIRGDIAKDANGNDLAWENANAVCPVVFGVSNCQETSIAVGDFMTGGVAQLTSSDGTTIEWMPSSGDYMIIISVTSNVLGDPGNDELDVTVSVKDFYDVEVGLEWIDGSGNSVGSTVEGEEVKDFRLTVSLVSPGDLNMTIRDASVEMTYTNVLSGDAASFKMGVNSTVNTFEVTEDPSQTVTNSRFIIGDDGNLGSHIGTQIGTITPSTTQGSGSVYQITATLTEFTIYDVHASCGSTAFETKKCEETFDSSTWSDEYSGSNVDTISGSTSTFHDASLYEFQVIGFDEEEESFDYYGGIVSDITSSLSPGEYILYAEVGYDSSSDAYLYDWNMSFSLTDMSGAISIVYADNCTLLPNLYEHQYLGLATTRTPDAALLGVACIKVDMTEGLYTIVADANIFGQYDESTGVVDSKVIDMSLPNNRHSMNVNIENFAPQILSLISDARDLVIGSQDSKQSITFTSVSFDVEGGMLTYLWTNSAGEELNCDSDSNVCQVAISESMIPSYELNLKVIDEYGEFDTSSISVSISNSGVYSSSGLSNGISAAYSITYMSKGLEVGFTNVSGVTDQTLPGFDGGYSSVGSFAINPSTTYDVAKIGGQTLTVNFGTELSATSLWMKVGNLWQLLDQGTAGEVDGTTNSYSHSWAAGTAMLNQGTEIYLFTGQLSQAQAPSANISGFTAAAQKAGSISINWNVNGTMLSDDKVVVNICESNSTCASPDTSSYLSGVTSMIYSGLNTVHGNTYYISASVCKSAMCSNEATTTVVADKEVAAVIATGMTITESNETWVLDWNASSVDSDVASWLVCYLKASFSSLEMSDLVGTAACVSTPTTDVTINKYTQSGTYNVHFAVVPVDVVGNIATAASTDFIEYSRGEDTSNPDDGVDKTEDEASTGVPTLIWGVIGLVVVAAFVVGAFILSRGEKGDDENKDWDY